MYCIVISQKIRDYRREKNISQTEFGEFFGVTAQSVSKWERGISYPDISLLPFLASVLCCSVDDLFEK
ncbi:MAG: helix-turn-helix transcriptional regulator [Ruminococcaceae bacterium]|nr:helix-turn-helix transcriptional regulator [Oscillospiraceae bacterium]